VPDAASERVILCSRRSLRKWPAIETPPVAVVFVAPRRSALPNSCRIASTLSFFSSRRLCICLIKALNLFRGVHSAAARSSPGRIKPTFSHIRNLEALTFSNWDTFEIAKYRCALACLGASLRLEDMTDEFRRRRSFHSSLWQTLFDEYRALAGCAIRSRVLSTENLQDCEKFLDKHSSPNRIASILNKAAKSARGISRRPRSLAEENDET
jgi:hypothetical protein